MSSSDQKSLSHENSLYFKAAKQTNSSDTASKEISPQQEIHDPNLNDHITIKALQITSNIWPAKRHGKELRKNASRTSIKGVQIRTLPPSHMLAGQTGLFAAISFRQYDIVGEYCGEVFLRSSPSSGEYCAYLEREKVNIFPLFLDAQHYGTECRAINHFENIADAPNVVMRTCYVEGLPRLMIVCKRDILVGEEFLLNYGKEYAETHLSGVERDKLPPEINKTTIKWTEMASSA